MRIRRGSTKLNLPTEEIRPSLLNVHVVLLLNRKFQIYLHHLSRNNMSETQLRQTEGSSQVNVVAGLAVPVGAGSLNRHYLTTQITLLRRDIIEKNEELSRFSSNLKDLQRQNDELKITLESKEGEIKALKEKISKLESEKNALESKLRSVESELEAVKKEVADLKETKLAKKRMLYYR